ncbi:hypothetical protein LZS85_15700 [Aliivibrio fischeri]|uniref:hypothetical protein n=1 Tax=Aliivibrio fischeri TaxID=668 RepID=UPI001F2E9613|nr:hypothetical protein [Aliivibrio fischeri]MCE7567568.1 hypothetical protein [Aliivibrio fischeri]
MRSELTLLDAIEILYRDLLGYKSPDFHRAYVKVAFTSKGEIEGVESGFNPDTMKHLLASVLAEKTGATCSIIEAQLRDELALRAIAAKNFIFLEPVLKKALSQHDAEIPNYGVAHAILSYGPDAPKHVDALLYVMGDAGDVPPKVKEETIKIFGGLLSDMGYSQDENGDWHEPE